MRFPPYHGGPTLSSAPCIFAENQLASCRLACHASVCLPSCAWLFETPWSVATQAPLSMEFSRQEHCSGLPCPPPGNLPNPGTEPMSLASALLAGGFFTTVPPGKPLLAHIAAVVQLLSPVWLFATPWTATACWAFLSFTIS